LLTAIPSSWPGSRRGWLLVATLAVTETTSYGVLAYAFGVFLAPMQQDLGWSPTALTGAYALAIVVSGVAAIPVGRWLDRHGARVLMTAGSAAATLLVLAWAHVTDLATFYGIWVGIGWSWPLCCTSLPLPSSPPGLVTEPSGPGPCWPSP
jgi:MFS family permease